MDAGVIGGGRSQTAFRRRASAAFPGRPKTRPAGSRGHARPTRRRRVPRPGPRLIAGLIVVGLLAGGAWLWLRNSSLVGVRHVTVSGVSGPDAGQIRTALTGAARGMTTLDVKLSALQTAVKPFPVVKHLTVSTSFPHGMHIDVSEQVPVAEITTAGRHIPVAADGTLLHDAAATGPLPTIAVAVFPGGTHVDGAAAPEVRLLAAAPYALLVKVDQVTTDPTHGLVAALHNGLKIYFGQASGLRAKWSAAAAVLASPTSVAASYVDVTDVSRPAAGAGPDGGSSSASGTATTGASGGTATATSPAETSTTGGG